MSARGVVVNIDPNRVLDAIRERVVTPRPDCALWANAVDRGYGRISIGGTLYRVHRVVWELTNGPIPEGMTIDHLCRVRSCVNVEHMELVTQAENAQRAAPFQPRRVVAPRTPKTHCKRGHEFTPENTKLDGKGHRKCRTCDREYARNRKGRGEAA